MKAGVLAALLAKVAPDAPVHLDGEGYAGWIHVSVAYDVNGEMEAAEITIHPMKE